MKVTTMALSLAACVSAAAVPPTGSESHWKLLPREETWNGDGEWDVRIHYGGGEFNWGDLPPWSALDTAGQDNHCDGGSCNQEWDIDTKRIMGNGDTMAMKIPAQAFYDEWARNGIIETLKHLSSLNYRVEHDQKAAGATLPCTNPLGCIPDVDGDSMDQYYAPKRFDILMTNKNDGRDYNMRLEAAEEADESVDICGPITGAVAGLVGAVNPWLGGGISLLSLACLATE